MSVSFTLKLSFSFFFFPSFSSLVFTFFPFPAVSRLSFASSINFASAFFFPSDVYRRVSSVIGRTGMEKVGKEPLFARNFLMKIFVSNFFSEISFFILISHLLNELDLPSLAFASSSPPFPVSIYPLHSLFEIPELFSFFVHPPIFFQHRAEFYVFLLQRV